MILCAEVAQISHHPPRFSGHRDLGREDIMVLVCHTILPGL